VADPAPSRISYRAQRLWLTPLFRALLRTGLPAFVIVMLVGSYLGNEANRIALLGGVEEMRREIENRPEFRVNVLGITGASAALTEEVRATLALDLPMPSFDLELDDLRARVEALPAVASADLRVEAGGYLAVAIAERVPAVIWQTGEGPMLLDASGAFVAALDQRSLDRPLPQVAGDGADRQITQALRLFRAASPLGDQVTGLVWMGERRWDVVLTGQRRILLPSQNPVLALTRVLALHDVTELFDRDIVRVDLRDPERLTVQLSPEALIEYRRLRQIEVTGDQSGEQAG
jgi:cell division protein FtsQ